MVKYVFPRVFSDEKSMEVGQLVLVALAIPIVFCASRTLGLSECVFYQQRWHPDPGRTSESVLSKATGYRGWVF